MSDSGIIVVVVVVVAIVCGAMVLKARGQSQRYDAMFAQCLADGHKEYQCYSMLRRNGRSLMTVPSRASR